MLYVVSRGNGSVSPGSPSSNEPSSSVASAAERRVSTLRRSTAEEPWQTRLRLATSGIRSEPKAEVVVVKTGENQPSWIGELSESEEQAAMMASLANEGFAGGAGDSRVDGSILDVWISEQGSEEMKARWAETKEDRQLDVIEKRANLLLTDLQGSFNLDVDTKDELYSVLVAKAEQEYGLLGQGKMPDGDLLDDWAGGYLTEMERILPAGQQQALVDWLGDQMADFWVSEVDQLPSG